MTNISHALQVWRKSRGLSQPKAAQSLGVPVRTLQGWESGRHRCACPSLLLRYLELRDKTDPTHEFVIS